MKPDLDIGVVLPTRNSMPHICTHIEALNQWIGRVKEVVVVDSQSDDGTVDYIREHLRYSNVVIIDHPPGLYQSWNAAICMVKSKYTYVATVNDYMPIETLEELYHQAEQNTADIVISPPRIVSGGALREGYQWPVHSFMEVSGMQHSYLLKPLELLVWNVVNLPGTMLGSSASNLYRTSFLHQNPFSHNFGHAGDSALALGATLNARWLFVPHVTSDFWYHGMGGNTSGGTGRGVRSDLYALASQQIEAISGSLSGQELKVIKALSELTRLWSQKENAVAGYLSYRKGRVPWVFLPAAWKLRGIKNQGNRKISKQVDVVLQQLGDLYCY